MINEEYKILKELSSSTAKVYKVKDLYDKRNPIKAIKYIDYSNINNDEKIKNIRHECVVIGKVNNAKNIVHYYSYVDNIKDKNIIIVMEYLKDINKYYNGKKITEKEIVKLGVDICTALKIFHKNNLVHGDLKPSNIFIDKHKNYKLGDFNSTVSNLEKTHYGTYSFIAPEIKDNYLTGKSDIYSLGLILYLLLNNGKLPFEENDYLKAIDRRFMGEEIKPIPGVNKNLMSIVIKCVKYNPDDRYTNVNELYADLYKLYMKGLGSTKSYSVLFSFLDKTVPVDSFIVKSKSIYKLKNKLRGYTLKSLIKKIILVALLLFLLFKGVDFYLINRNCSKGYVNSNGKCIKGKYICNEGEKLDGKYCEKLEEEIPARNNYYCKEGYILNEGYCVSSDTKSANYKFFCPDDFTLNQGKCIHKESADAPSFKYCSDKYILIGDDCVSADSFEASVRYYCINNDYKLQGDRCIKSGSTTSRATEKYTCKDGGTLTNSRCELLLNPSLYEPNVIRGWYNQDRYYCNGTASLTSNNKCAKCSKGTYNSRDEKCHYTYVATKNLVCPDGSISYDGMCHTTSVSNIAALPDYSCPAGYTVIGNMCTKAKIMKALTKYVCSDDTVLENGRCIATITADAVGTYTCDEGYLLSGLTCIKDDYYNPEIKYTCSRLYELKDDKCQKITRQKAKIEKEK